MRALYWLMLAIPLALGCDGKGKSSTEKLEGECLSACSDFRDFLERCDFLEDEYSCEDECSEVAATATESGCEDELEAFLDCSNSLNWPGAECTEEAAVSNLSTCLEQETEWALCHSSSDTGPAGN